MHLLYSIIALMALAACKLNQSQISYPSKDLSKTQINALLTDRPKQSETLPLSPFFPLTDPIAWPTSKFPELDRKISFKIDESIEIKDVFTEICKQGKINLLLDKNIQGSLHYQVFKRPMIEVIQNICEILNLRFKIDNHLLKIERDLPYLQTYDIQFLNVIRKTESIISVNSNLLNNDDDKKTSSNGSSSSISSKIEIDFWHELEKTFENILQISKEERSRDEEVEITEEKKLLNDDSIYASQSPKIISNNYTDYPNGQKDSKNIRIHEKKKRVFKKFGSFAIHRQGGIVSVHGTEKQHIQIKNFLQKLKRQISTQVLIEAKVIEVHLKEEYKSGVDWQKIGRMGLGAYGTVTPFSGDVNASALFGEIAQKKSSIISTPETDQVISLGLRGNSLSAVLSFIESFGTVHTLSSPRLTILNNQSAILKVAENYVFFRIKSDRALLNNDTNNYGTLVSTTSTPQSVPIGLVMMVQPSIDAETQEIILTLRPTISRLIDVKEDPSIQLLNQSLDKPSSTLKSNVPVVAVREIDSVLRVKSGNIAILGGLMFEGAEKGSVGIPGTSEKFFSFFTSSKRESRIVTELVIFLKATILDSSMPDAADERLYKKFTSDPRGFYPSSSEKSNASKAISV